MIFQFPLLSTPGRFVSGVHGMAGMALCDRSARQCRWFDDTRYIFRVKTPPLDCRLWLATRSDPSGERQRTRLDGFCRYGRQRHSPSGLPGSLCMGAGISTRILQTPALLGVDRGWLVPLLSAYELGILPAVRGQCIARHPRHMGIARALYERSGAPGRNASPPPDDLLHFQCVSV